MTESDLEHLKRDVPAEVFKDAVLATLTNPSAWDSCEFGWGVAEYLAGWEAAREVPLAKAAYEAMLERYRERLSGTSEEDMLLSWADQRGTVREDWRAAIRAAMEIRDAQWLVAVGPDFKPEDLCEVKPDAVTR